MPLMFLNFTEGTFSTDSLDRLVASITQAGIELEKLPLTDYVASTTWVFTREYPRNRVFHGGKPGGGSNFVALEINVIQGGFSASTKQKLISRVTDAFSDHANLPEGEPRRIYVIIREVAESNWGFDGQTIDLEALRNPPEDAKPL